MSSINSILNSNAGIQDILDMQGNDALPEARQIAASVLRDASFEDVYTAKNYTALVENLLCPEVGDGEILRPDIFAYTLETCAETLKSSTDKDVQAFLQNDLYPLMENKDLLRVYTGLMIGG